MSCDVFPSSHVWCDDDRDSRTQLSLNSQCYEFSELSQHESNICIFLNDTFMPLRSLGSDSRTIIFCYDTFVMLLFITVTWRQRLDTSWSLPPLPPRRLSTLPPDSPPPPSAGRQNNTVLIQNEKIIQQLQPTEIWSEACLLKQRGNRRWEVFRRLSYHYPRMYKSGAAIYSESLCNVRVVWTESYFSSSRCVNHKLRIYSHNKHVLIPSGM